MSKLGLYICMQSFLLLSCSKLEDSGDMMTITKSISADVCGVEVGSGFSLEVDSLYNSNELVVELYESVEPYLSCEIKNNILYLSIDKARVDDDLHLKAYLPIDMLSEYRAKGKSIIRLNTHSTFPEFRIDLSGGSTFVGELECEKLTYNSTGGSMGYLYGKTDTFNISECSGGSVVESFGLISDSVDLLVSGGSRLEITAKRSIKGSATGSSSIYYKGCPTAISVDAMGGSIIVSDN